MGHPNVRRSDIYIMSITHCSVLHCNSIHLSIVSFLQSLVFNRIIQFQAQQSIDEMERKPILIETTGKSGELLQTIRNRIKQKSLYCHCICIQRNLEIIIIRTCIQARDTLKIYPRSSMLLLMYCCLNELLQTTGNADCVLSDLLAHISPMGHFQGH